MSESAGRQPVGYVRFNWTMVGVVVTLLLQSGALIIWGAKIDQRVGSLEQRIGATEGLSETVARVDERTQALLVTTNRIDQRLDSQDRRR